MKWAINYASNKAIGQMEGFHGASHCTLPYAPLKEGGGGKRNWDYLLRTCGFYLKFHLENRNSRMTAVLFFLIH